MLLAPSYLQLSGRLYHRWFAEFDQDEDLVVSASSALGVLGVLASSASGVARTELAEALGINPEEGIALARCLFNGLNDGLVGGAGFWLHDSVEPYANWLASVGFATVERLPQESSRFSDWVAEVTNGVITGVDVETSPDDRLVALSSIAAQAQWARPFSTGYGGWTGTNHRCFNWLSRNEASGSDSVGVIFSEDLQLSHVVVESCTDLDVHLVAGPFELPAAGVLSAAMNWLGGSGERVSADDLPLGTKAGCLTVALGAGNPTTCVSLPAFQVATSVDLLETGETFGLVAATDTNRGHFDVLAASPLAVSRATQDAFISFSDTGLTAGATTVVQMRAGQMMSRERSRKVDVAHSRPFGYLVVDRTTGVVHFAGWVATPAVLTQSEL